MRTGPKFFNLELTFSLAGSWCQGDMKWAHGSVSSFKLIRFPEMQQNALNMIDQIFLFLFLSERLFYLFSDVQNCLITYWIFFGLFWFRPPFLNFTAGKSPAYDFKDIRLTNRTAGIAGWPWRWLVEICKMHPRYSAVYIWPYSRLPITRTLADSNLALTRTKIDFPWISVIHSSITRTRLTQIFVSPQVIFYIKVTVFCPVSGHFSLTLQ